MSENKEYIINIRVSKDVYEKLKRKARENSQTLSSLVRKTINDSYEVFKDFKREIFNGDNKNNNILYYQKIITATETTCERCHSKISRGNETYMGETKSGFKKYFCNNCFVNNPH